MAVEDHAQRVRPRRGVCDYERCLRTVELLGGLIKQKLLPERGLCAAA